MSRLLPTLTSHDVAELRPTVTVLPIGSFEQHGGHLPLVTDTAIACIVAKAVSEQHGLMLLPPITISCSHEHNGPWPGTVSISARTLHALIGDIVDSLETTSGIRKVLLVSGHGGNYVLSNVVQEANAAPGAPRMTLFPNRQDWDQARADAGLESTGHDDMHAGEIETSILLHAAPDLVGDEYREADYSSPDRPFLTSLGMAAYTRTGVIGFPSLATAAKGEAVIDSLVQSVVYHLKTLEEE
jgi:creatinine amidohydrolase